MKIYALKHPITLEVRYIGITKNSLKTRLREHINVSARHPNKSKLKAEWINQLKAEGLKPLIELIDTTDSYEELQKLEKYYINEYKKKTDLLNMTVGGDSGDKAGIKIPVDQYTIDGVFVNSYASLSDALAIANPDGGKSADIRYVCQGTRNIAFGYVWRFAGEPFDTHVLNRNSTYIRKFNQFTTKGELVKTWSSYNDASKALGIKAPGQIYDCLIGKFRSCKGFLWFWEDEPFHYLERMVLKYVDDVLVEVYMDASKAAKDLGITASSMRHLMSKQTSDSKIKFIKVPCLNSSNSVNVSGEKIPSEASKEERVTTSESVGSSDSKRGASKDEDIV